ncbi:hypothetical protein [Rhodohalobacter sp.]|uniref:hypothetical protein n=1 Tax=Rhodohalobacter sp. TaxID=1974210 RepID=UPI002ACDDE12|nr:hypothetical protein [Rhodohalobacter sp.]MDZ7755974.1 hypothetical protein [Rhodohalobacter sp.]
MPLRTFTLASIGFLTLTLSCAQTNPQTFQCSEYEWQSVQDLVFPYLEDEMQTAMVMQAQSSEYQPAAAADFALTFEEAYPDSVTALLQKIEKCQGSPS